MRDFIDNVVLGAKPLAEWLREHGKVTDGPSPTVLTHRQEQILGLMRKHLYATGEECTVAYLARRLNLNSDTVRREIKSLYVARRLPQR